MHGNTSGDNKAYEKLSCGHCGQTENLSLLSVFFITEGLIASKSVNEY